MQKGTNLASVTLEFTQEGNTNGTTEESETLEVSLESPLFIDTDGHYFVIRTSSGWSFDDVEELTEIINKCNEVGKVFLRGNE